MSQSKQAVYVAPTADVHGSASLGDGCKIWHLAQIREHARLGRECIVGRGAYVGVDVVMGDYVKVQNHALLYEPAIIGSGVFVGPGAVLTNDRNPRAVTPEGTLKSSSDWQTVGVVVGDGASIGARAVCVAPLRIGRWAMVAAGAVVTSDVPDFGLVMGVPARRVGWVGRAGRPLVNEGDGEWSCPETGMAYRAHEDRLVEEPPR